MGGPSKQAKFFEASKVENFAVLTVTEQDTEHKHAPVPLLLSLRRPNRVEYIWTVLGCLHGYVAVLYRPIYLSRTVVEARLAAIYVLGNVHWAQTLSMIPLFF